MSYTVFTNEMLEAGIEHTTLCEYEAARKLYHEDLKHGETDLSFGDWLEWYIRHAIMDGY